jgi:DNA-binding MarR family transcriptional regulator
MAQRPRDEEDNANNQLPLWLRTSIIGMVQIKDVPDLSMRQLAVLLLCHTSEKPQTVRGLAAALDVSKPAVTRAIDRLTASGLVRRIPDAADGRSVLVQVKASGHALCRSFGKAPKSA